MHVRRALVSFIDALDIFGLMDPGIPLDELPSWYATGTRVMFAAYTLWSLFVVIIGVGFLAKML